MKITIIIMLSALFLIIFGALIRSFQKGMPENIGPAECIVAFPILLGLTAATIASLVGVGVTLMNAILTSK